MDNENVPQLPSGFPTEKLATGLVGFAAAFIAKIYAEKAFGKLWGAVKEHRNKTPNESV